MSRAQLLGITLCLVLFLPGCGGSGNASTTSGLDSSISSPTSDDVPNPDPTLPVPDAPQPQTTSLVFRFTLQPRSLPSSVDELRFSAYDAENQLVYGPESRERSPVLQLDDVPLTATQVLVELLSQGQVLGLYSQSVDLSQDQTLEIIDPLFARLTELKWINSADLTSIVRPGDTIAWHAIGVFLKPGSAQTYEMDMTQVVAWKVDSPAIVAVEGPGILNGLAPGVARVSVALPGSSTDLEVGSLQVTSGQLYELRLEGLGFPPLATLRAGLRYTFDALAFFDDGIGGKVNSTAHWTSSNPSVLSVDRDGAFRALMPGAAQVRVEYGGLLQALEFQVEALALTIYDSTRQLAGQANPTSSISVDLFNDLKPALITLDSTGGNLLVLRGLAEESSQPIGLSGARGLAGADFDEDGWIDLVTCLPAEDQLAFLTGQGDGTFLAPRLLPVDPHPGELLALDVNQDQHQDLLVLGDGRLQIWLGDGQGGFVRGSSASLGADTRRLAWRPNSQGHIFLAAVNPTTQTIVWLSLDAAGRLSEPQTIGSGLSLATQVSLADLNADGNLDLAVSWSSGVTLFVGSGPGQFSQVGPLALPGGAEATGVVASDLNLDGNVDLAIAASSGIWLAEGSGGPAFATPRHLSQSGPAGGLLLHYRVGERSFLPDLVAEPPTAGGAVQIVSAQIPAF